METQRNQTIFVLSQDDSTREAAMSFCDELVQRFWTECSFDIAWCSFKDLMRQGKGAKLVSQAAAANMIIVAVLPNTWVPSEVRHWADNVAQERSEREGALIGLLDPSARGEGEANAYTWARRFAHDAGLDYLTQAPASVSAPRNSIDSCSLRATTVTSVLDEILKYHPLPATTRGGGRYD